MTNKATSRRPATDLQGKLVARFSATKNPIDAWTALALRDLSQPLPPELAAYLKRAAQNIGILGGQVHNAKLTTKQAAARVPAALGIVAQSYNAFLESEKDNDASWTAVSADFLGRNEDDETKRQENKRRVIAFLADEEVSQLAAPLRTGNAVRAAQSRIKRRLKRAGRDI